LDVILRAGETYVIDRDISEADALAYLLTLRGGVRSGEHR
jgi:hypothetical protein